jgi:hypothetical protein
LRDLLDRVQGGRNGGGRLGRRGAWEKTNLSNGLLVGHHVGCGGGCVAGVEGVADQCGAEGFDHEFVVVEGGDDGGGGGVADGGLDVGGRHLGFWLRFRGGDGRWSVDWNVVVVVVGDKMSCCDDDVLQQWRPPPYIQNQHHM